MDCSRDNEIRLKILVLVNVNNRAFDDRQYIIDSVQFISNDETKRHFPLTIDQLLGHRPDEQNLSKNSTVNSNCS